MQLVVSIAGAAVGAVFGPVGAQIGWAVGSLVGSQFGPKQKSQGPRLDDLRVTGVEYGQTIPWAAGHPRVAGQVWWASDRREIATTTSQGKGPGGAESTSYTYEVDILYGLVDREIVTVTRIWSNGKLIYSLIPGADAETQNASTNSEEWSRLTIYTGGVAQLPDPTYEAVVGAGNAPAYRGRGSLFIEGLKLGSSGVIPNLTFEVVLDADITQSTAIVLLHADGTNGSTDIPDATVNQQVVTAAGGVALTTSVKEFGTASINFNGSGYANVEINPDVDIGGITNNPTWQAQCWVRFSRISNTEGIFSLVKAGDPEFYLYVYRGTDQKIRLWVGNLGQAFIRIISTSTFAVGVFHHVALSFSDETWRLYVDGALEGSFSGGTGPQNSSGVFELSKIYLGTYDKTTEFLQGQIDEFFMQKNEVVYTGPVYDVPQVPFDLTGLYTIYDDTIQNVVEDLCAEAGMDANTYDATALSSITKPVRAFTLSQVATIRSALEVLMSAYFFEAYVTDKIYFVPRAGSVADAIDVDDMGAGMDAATSDLLPTQITSKIELPPQVAVSYANVDADYTTATEQSDRLI